ncbi:hypothetical protein HN587_05410 [Candidatus Woesearchaeota archaeon]|jgi:hypothetical protein|nr:hypothetical protein [Candidatus Woesearchaeota archaeon]
MPQQSVFRGIIEFFGDLGVYDVILPFILVFTIVFAILEKSQVFGSEKIKDVEYTRKNLNSMAAFVIAFLVVASTRLVAIINQALAHMVLLLLVSVCFLILIGSFMKEGEVAYLKEGWWRTSFMIAMLIGIILIFMNALGWLEPSWAYLINHWDSNIVGSIALMILVIVFMYFIVKSPKDAADKKD